MSSWSTNEAIQNIGEDIMKGRDKSSENEFSRVGGISELRDKYFQIMRDAQLAHDEASKAIEHARRQREMLAKLRESLPSIKFSDA